MIKPRTLEPSPVFAEPRVVDEVSQCFFYHDMNVPQHGPVKGLCDMRSALPAAVDDIDFRHKRVIEIGPASGFFTFAMEKAGADVVAVELSPTDEWDIVQHRSNDPAAVKERFREHLMQLRNGFWFAHRRFASSSKVCHARVYDIPDDLGSFDIGTIHNVLLHLRDPFLAMEKVSQFVRDTMIISDIEPWAENRRKTLLRLLARRIPIQVFHPRHDDHDNTHTWWHLSPKAVAEYCRLLGFVNVTCTYYRANVTGRWIPGYVIVARRAAGN